MERFRFIEGLWHSFTKYMGHDLLNFTFKVINIHMYEGMHYRGLKDLPVKSFTFTC